jgi:acetate kinase
MKSLALIPLKDKIEFYFLLDNNKKEAKSGVIPNFRRLGIKKAIEEIFRILEADSLRPDFLAIRAQYGGMLFKAPELADENFLKRLESIIPQAPLHIPPLIALCEELKKILPEIPLAVVFETSFFTALPEREANYALPRDLSEKLNLRRMGYHGIFHRGAKEETARVGAAKVISICLEPRPEITAAINGNPLLTTSGATPLEGLPGETSSGEIDPLIITALNKKLNYGPEQINSILSEKSGIAGLTGGKGTLPGIFESSDPEFKLVRDMMEYRILRACGAAVAAMGGVDMIIFSGRYHSLGEPLEKYLRRKLKIKNAAKIKYSTLKQSLPSLLADYAESVVIGKELRERKGKKYGMM